MLKSTPLGSKRDPILPHPILMPASQRSAASISSAQGKPEVSHCNRLVVGANVRLLGAQIQDCDTLVVEGQAEATLDCRVIHIAPGGAFSGKVSIDIAEIRGHFSGDLEVRDQLTIHSTGKVSGKIRYGKLLIEEGGELSGDIQMVAGKTVLVENAPVKSA